eukprot:59682_1
MCKKGHTLVSISKNLENHKCIECGVRNPGYNKNYETPNKKQMKTFLNSYDINQIPFGPSEEDKKYYKVWEEDGTAAKYPLHFAAYTGNVNVIKKLCEMKDINLEQKRTD